MGKVNNILNYLFRWIIFNSAYIYFKNLQQKNHTGRNATHKAHVNGIKRNRDYPSKSLKGVSYLIIYTAMEY